MRSQSHLRGPAKPISEKAIQNGSFGHWPGHPEKKGRADVQDAKAPLESIISYCTKCDVHLCLTPKNNCFRNFHNEQSCVYVAS